MTIWQANWLREDVEDETTGQTVSVWRLVIADEDEYVWLDRSVGMANPDAGPPTGLILKGSGWQPAGDGWCESGGVWSTLVHPQTPEMEAQLREEAGLA